MLARAGKIFSSLTLGSFDKLVVDFDSDPLALEGRRVDGATVGVTGMSDGTRDQLYLARRLAALDIHLEHTQPLPFIADDLFINYDDARSKAGFEALAKLAIFRTSNKMPLAALHFLAVPQYCLRQCALPSAFC